MTVAEVKPAPERPSTLRIWLLAIRPATLPAAMSGVIVGLGAALAVDAPFRADMAVGCLAVAILLQVTANLANDLSDFRKGADTPDRTGPVRVAAAGLVTERQLEVAIALVIGLAGVVGLWLTVVGGPVLLALGVLAVIAALAYTGGPWPYGYRGLGEVFVFVFFGLVAVVGTAYLQAGRLEPVFVWAAIPVGALTTAILVVNNLRDIPTDTAAGKRTLAVILGARATTIEYVVAAGRRLPGAGRPRSGRWRPDRPPATPHDPAGVPAVRDRAHVRGTAPAQPGPEGDRPPGTRPRPPLRRRAGALGVTGVTAIRALVADRVRIPFRRPFPTARGMWVERDAWLIRLVADDGRVGLGEAVLETEPGETQDVILTALIREAAEGVPGHLPSMAELELHGAPGRALNAALESALLDLERGLHPELSPGGDGVGVNATIPSLGADAAAEAARQSVESGFLTLKVKAGAERETDVLVERVRAIRDAVGPDVLLRLDVNGAWDLATAEDRLEAIARFDIEFVEQPLAGGDVDALAELRRRVRVPIAADEAADSVRAAWDLLRADAVDVLVIKPARVGGPAAVAEIADLAAERGVPVVISTLFETGIGIAAALTAAAALPVVATDRWAAPPDHGLATAGLLDHDLLTESLIVADGRMHAPARTGSGGLGVVLDDRAVERFRVEAVGSAG